MPSPIGNFFIKILINSPMHTLLGESFAVITLTGRKSGKSITTPINTVNVDGVLTVVSTRDRTWWRNLRGGRVAQLRHTGKQFAVRGEIVESPDDVLSNLAKYFAQYPGYAKYLGVHTGPDGKPDPKDLKRVAGERVVIHLFPI